MTTPDALRKLVEAARPCKCKRKAWNSWCKHDDARVQLDELGRPLAEYALAAQEALEEVEPFNEHADACIFCGDAPGDTHTEACKYGRALAMFAEMEVPE